MRGFVVRLAHVQNFKDCYPFTKVFYRAKHPFNVSRVFPDLLGVIGVVTPLLVKQFRVTFFQPSRPVFVHRMCPPRESLA